MPRSAHMNCTLDASPAWAIADVRLGGFVKSYPRNERGQATLK